MMTGAIDPYDIAVRVDLGEIQETDLPRIFSGDTKGLAECKRYLYKLRSDRILYQEAAIIKLVEKLRYMSSPQMIQAAVGQVVKETEQTLKADLEGHHRRIKTAVSPFYKGSTSIHYNVFYEETFPSPENPRYNNMISQGLFSVDVEKNKDTIRNLPRGTVISKSTYRRIHDNIKRVDKIIGGVLGTGERRLIEMDILENKDIPFLSGMWGIAVLGDILDMLGKALGGNL